MPVFTQKHLCNVDMWTQHLILYLFLNLDQKWSRQVAPTGPGRPAEGHTAALAPPQPFVHRLPKA